MKGSIMQLRNIVFAISLGAVSTPLLAGVTECTNLDKSHWIPAQAMQQMLANRGYKVIHFEVTDSCYRTRLETRQGKRVDAIYHPVGGHPMQRKVI
jgi:hypothetical protein